MISNYFIYHKMILIKKYKEVVLMLTDLVDNYDIDNDELIELPQLKDLHYELINENIKDQIEDPTESHVNFIDQYFLSVESELNENEENIELVQNLKADIVKFCNEVI